VNKSLDRCSQRYDEERRLVIVWNCAAHHELSKCGFAGMGFGAIKAFRGCAKDVCILRMFANSENRFVDVEVVSEVVVCPHCRPFKPGTLVCCSDFRYKLLLVAP